MDIGQISADVSAIDTPVLVKSEEDEDLLLANTSLKEFSVVFELTEAEREYFDRASEAIDLDLDSDVGFEEYPPTPEVPFVMSRFRIVEKWLVATRHDDFDARFEVVGFVVRFKTVRDENGRLGIHLGIGVPNRNLYFGLLRLLDKKGFNGVFSKMPVVQLTCDFLLDEKQVVFETPFLAEASDNFLKTVEKVCLTGWFTGPSAFDALEALPSLRSVSIEPSVIKSPGVTTDSFRRPYDISIRYPLVKISKWFGPDLLRLDNVKSVSVWKEVARELDRSTKVEIASELKNDFLNLPSGSSNPF